MPAARGKCSELRSRDRSKQETIAFCFLIIAPWPTLLLSTTPSMTFWVRRGRRTRLTTGFIYSALVIAGGVMGFVKKGSVASLIAGGGTGVLAGWGAYVR